MIKKTNRALSLLLSFVIMLSFIPFNKVEAAGYKTMTVTIPEGSLDNPNLSKVVNIPNLKSIVSVSTNTGTVSYTIDGDNVTLNARGGSPSRVVNNPCKKSKAVTDTRLSQGSNNNPATISYNSGGFSGTLKKGTTTSKQVQTGGSYTAAQSRTETATRTTQGTDTTPATVSYNSGGFSGTLRKVTTTTEQVQTGGSPADSKYVTGQTSPNYNSGGYSGTLAEYVHSGEEISEHTKTVIEGTQNITFCNTGVENS